MSKIILIILVSVSTAAVSAVEMPRLRTKPSGKDWVPLDTAGTHDLFMPDLDIGPGLNPPMVRPGSILLF